MSTETHRIGTETVYFSGKEAEEVGFGKFSQRQAKLQGIHVLVLEHMRIKHTAGLRGDDREEIQRICGHITRLDVSGNLFETLAEIVDLCSLFPKLQSLTLDGNRFMTKDRSASAVLPTVRTLSLSDTLLTTPELSDVLRLFPSLQTLTHTSNALTTFTLPTPCDHLTTLDLSSNNLASLSSIESLLSHAPVLETLNLNNNDISALSPATLPKTLHTLHLANNAISTFAHLDALRTTLPSLRHLRVTGNPLYTDLRSATNTPLTAEDGYMLTIARLPALSTLNFSRIGDKERLNAETYYLGQIAAELEIAGDGGREEVLERHPRWEELCEEYGEPVVKGKGKREEAVDPRSLAARLVVLEFEFAADVAPEREERVWRTEVPKSFDVYAVLGLVGRELNVSPLQLELFLESGEEEVAGARDSAYAGPEWWDSSDEEDEGAGGARFDGDGSSERAEISLVPGTRAIGTYVDGKEGRVKVRMRPTS